MRHLTECLPDCDGWPCRCPCHDIATYAMPALGLDRPVGLAQIAERLGVRAPDHTAAGDVLTLRACYIELAARYAEHGPSIRAAQTGGE